MQVRRWTLFAASLVFVAGCPGSEGQRQSHEQGYDDGYLAAQADLQEELDALAAAVDALTAASLEQEGRLAALEGEDWATETWVTSLDLVSQAELEPVMADVDAHAAQLDTLELTSAGQAADLNAIEASVANIELDYLQVNDLSGYATETWVDEQGYTTEDWVDGQGFVSAAGFDGVESSEMGDLLTLVPLLEVVGNDVVLSGANFRVESGAGAGMAPNGLGNIVVGYDQDDGFDVKTGSHNIVVGDFHSYTGQASIVTGENHSSMGDYSALLGGQSNSATADHAAVVGGNENVASGDWATVLGGYQNTASGQGATVTGGTANEADGDFSVVGWGDGRTVSNTTGD